MALTNGLYKVGFQTPLGEGFGVVTLEDGRLLGGDSMMYYIGTYQQNGDAFTAQVSVATHSVIPGGGSVFGVPEATIQLNGSSTGNTAQVSGSSPQAPGVGFTASLTRLH